MREVELAGNPSDELLGEYEMAGQHTAFAFVLKKRSLSFVDYIGDAVARTDLDGYSAMINGKVLFIVIPQRRYVLTLHAVKLRNGIYGWCQPYEVGRLIQEKSLIYEMGVGYSLFDALPNPDVAIQQMALPRSRAVPEKVDAPPPPPPPK